MLPRPRAQLCFALLALLSPALCAAVDDPASRPPGARPFIGLLLPLNAPEFSRAAEAVRLGCQAALVFADNRQSLQVARMAFARGLREGAVVQASNLLAKRLSRAFADEWFSLGGRISDVREFGARADLIDLRRGLADSQAQFIFLAAEADQARSVRPYLNNQLQVFATSQVNDGKNDPLVNSDLNGIRFVDMPWLVQPDHAAVMVYPRLEGLSTELQRFYALGIDSCRIAGELIGGQQTINLDGVTGRISYRGGNTLQREPIQAVFRDGVGVSLENAR